MAKNYSLKEVVQVIVENEDAAQIVDIGKRFPLLASKVTRIAVIAGEAFDDLMQFMPDNLTANKVNQTIKKSLEEVDDDEEFDEEDAGEEDDAPKTKAKPASKAKGGESSSDYGDYDYENWNNAKMYKFLGELGKRKDCKEKMGGLDKASMTKYLKKYYPGGAGAEDDEDFDDDAEEQVSYEGMKAPELYKLCKERKIKVAPKKPAKYYIDMLKKQDSENEAEAEDEGWDEDEEPEEEAPKKPEKPAKAKGKPASKPAKKAEKVEDDDEDEDWDI